MFGLLAVGSLMIAQSQSIEFVKHGGMQCTGSLTDILRDFEGTAEECEAKCEELDGCVGFVRVNSGSIFADKCYFRGGALHDPSPYANDDRDCYEAVSTTSPRHIVFVKHTGMQCTGSLTDILRDFEGTAEECIAKCESLDDCVGFVRVNAGSVYAEKCYFRGGILSDPTRYTNDDRDCFAPLSSEPKTIPFYRYWKGSSADHFYTTNEEEIGTTTAGETGKYEYQSEGMVGRLAEDDATGPKVVNLYRYWNAGISDHFYTTNVDEIGTITSGETGQYGYHSEGVAGKCFTDQDARDHLVPLYRYWNPGNNDHFYTTNVDEIGTITSGETGQYGYQSEGISCYIFGVTEAASTGHMSASDHDLSVKGQDVSVVEIVLSIAVVVLAIIACVFGCLYCRIKKRYSQLVATDMSEGDEPQTMVEGQKEPTIKIKKHTEMKRELMNDV
eukprot:280512_1